MEKHRRTDDGRIEDQGRSLPLTDKQTTTRNTQNTQNTHLDRLDGVRLQNWLVAHEFGLVEPVEMDDLHLLRDRALARLASTWKTTREQGTADGTTRAERTRTRAKR